MKIGLIGWACKTGNGLWNYDLAKLPQVHRWLALSHPTHGIDRSLTNDPEVASKTVIAQPAGETKTYISFLKGIDVLLFVEQPYVRGFDLVHRAQNFGVKIACIPMWEWFNIDQQWTKRVDVMFASTKKTVDHLEECQKKLIGQRCDWKDNVHFVRPGLWLDEFPFRHRFKADRFVFVNGRGGISGRKGIESVEAVARRLPHVNFIVYSQKKKIPSLPTNVDLRGEQKHRHELYQDGDVFIYPSSLEGLAHQIYEAKASGMPVVTTNAAPMNEPDPARLIDVAATIQRNVGGQMIPFSMPNINHFVEVVDDINGKDITGESYAARNWIENNYDRADSAHEMVEILKNAVER